MRRGEQKELPAGEPNELFPSETSRFQNGNAPLSFSNLPPAFRLAASEVGVLLLFWLLLCCIVCLASCGGGSSFAQNPPPPPPPITVTVTPHAAQVLLGNSVDFTASVSGTSNTGVGWAVNGVPGGSSAMGTISSAGVYQAPAILPSLANMQVVATSQVDASSSASATVALMSDITVQVSPSTVNLPLGGSQTFTAAIASAGHPSSAVSWSLSGPGCTAAACGTISSAGLYTAPSIPPQPPQLTVTATSVADPSKSASAAVSLSGTHSLSVAPAGATLALEQTQFFSATLDGSPTLSITWSVNGITGGNASLGTISNSPSMNGLYLAPVDMPASRSVTIAATSTAFPSLSSSVSLQLTSNIQVAISPASSTRLPGTRQSFTASVTQTSDPQLRWTVNGVTNGNASVGLICVSGSIPCTAPLAPSPSGSVDYLAPSAVPSPPQITVAAVSAADPARSASATVNIASQISVTISPPSLTLPPLQIQSLTATVLGVADQNVSWDVNGSPNGSIAAGLICLPASSPCQAPSGPYSGPVEFRAPAAPPNPGVVSVRATTEALPAAQATLAVTISTSPYITGLVPASLFAGAQNSFGLRVSGVLFAASQPGPGSSILINGVPRATTCPSPLECDATLGPSDVASPGTLTVSLRNSGGDSSNAVSLIVVAPQSSQSSIALDSSSPLASGIDLTVVEPTLAGSDPPAQLALFEIGTVDPASGTCLLGAPPLLVSRPAGGVSTVRLCLFGTSLDQVSQVSFSSPSSPDLSAANLDFSGGGLLLVFDLAVPAGAASGPRTLFVTTANLDFAAFTAALEVK